MESRAPLGRMRAQRASVLTICVTGDGAGVDKVWEQYKPEARKMLKNGDESHLSSARCVGRFFTNHVYGWIVSSETGFPASVILNTTGFFIRSPSFLPSSIIGFESKNTSEFILNDGLF
jgi:hypothetical protein